MSSSTHMVNLVERNTMEMSGSSYIYKYKTSKLYTLPETDIFAPENHGFEDEIPEMGQARPIFRGENAVSFRESQSIERNTPPKFNIAPEKLWLEDEDVSFCGQFGGIFSGFFCC